MKTITYDSTTGAVKQAASGSMQVPEGDYIEVDEIPADLYQNWRVDITQDPPILIPIP